MTGSRQPQDAAEFPQQQAFRDPVPIATLPQVDGGAPKPADDRATRAAPASSRTPEQEEDDAWLDAALADSFPASDPLPVRRR